MENQHGIGMIGWIQGTPRGEDDTVRGCYGGCRRTGQEAESTSGGSLMKGGADRGNRNNRFITIIDRA